MGINLGNNGVLLNNPGIFFQLCPIRPHKQEPVSFPLPSGFPVEFRACQGEQKPLDQGEPVLPRERSVGHTAQAEENPVFLQHRQRVVQFLFPQCVAAVVMPLSKIFMTGFRFSFVPRNAAAVGIRPDFAVYFKS